MIIARLTRIAGITADGLLSAPVYLQVPSLDDITISGEADWADYEALGGQFSLPGSRTKLKTLELHTMTVHTAIPSWVLPITHPLSIWVHLELLRDRHSPFWLLLFFAGGSTGFLDNIPVTIRSLSKTTRFGEPGTVYWDVSLVEWRPPIVGTRKHGSGGGLGATSPAKSRVPGVKLPAIHKLKTNDTLRILSEKYYGHRDGITGLRKRNGMGWYGSTARLVLYKGLNIGSKFVIPQYVKPEDTRKGVKN